VGLISLFDIQNIFSDSLWTWQATKGALIPAVAAAVDGEVAFKT
jgi:hypothetical protein